MTSETRKFTVKPIALVGDYVDKIRWMDRVCFKDNYTLTFDGAYWFMAFDEDKIPCAYAAFTILPTGFGFLSRAGVLPGARGHGLQKRLVRARERNARGFGVSRMVTYTSLDNVQSSNNLIKSGYRLYVPPYEWGIKNGLYWERMI